jgi:hypothetical protein
VFSQLALKVTEPIEWHSAGFEVEFTELTGGVHANSPDLHMISFQGVQDLLFRAAELDSNFACGQPVAVFFDYFIGKIELFWEFNCSASKGLEAFGY